MQPSLSVSPLLRSSLVPLIAALALVGCNPGTPPATPTTLNTDPFDPPITREEAAEQNWDANTRDWFYTTTQGSQLLPYALFLHLENAADSELWRGDSNMNRWRYLPQAASRNNPDALPIGWVKDSTGTDQSFVGLTCAACHTSKIQVGNTAITIDGGAGQADMDSMLHALEAALAAPLQDAAKLSRLASKLSKSAADTRALLTDAHIHIQQYNRANASVHKVNDATIPVAYGYSRLDAFGRIYNRILSHLTPNDPSNANSANAPVSYPVLWDTPQADFVQWNGVGDNADNGPLGRNTGEVLGVFAAMDLHPDANRPGYASSANLKELEAMETAITQLQSPSWRELAARDLLPAIDETLAARGAEVFKAYECGACHMSIDRQDPARRPLAQFYGLGLIGTDPAMAANALSYQGKSGLFEGQPISLASGSLATFGPTTPVLPALSNATEGVIIRALSNAKTAATAEAVDGGYSGHGVGARAGTSASNAEAAPNPRYLNFEAIDKKLPQGLLAYKGRPLNGIFSSAPYLHNGSVPNLYAMFLPHCSSATQGACRPARFGVGSRVLDVKQVGFVDLDPAVTPGAFMFDTQLPGNSNRGHEFTSGVTPMVVRDAQGRATRDASGAFITKTFPVISEADRWALVEYLKTL